MKVAARPITLFATLALGSFALGAATTSKLPAVPAAPRMVQSFPISGGDASVPSASTVSFGADDAMPAPTF